MYYLVILFVNEYILIFFNLEKIFLKEQYSWVLAAHTCDPSYSGGRDQEDWGLKPARGNSPQDPVSKKKKTFTKKGWWSSSRYRP
jgi:hypothetical protein